MLQPRRPRLRRPRRRVVLAAALATAALLGTGGAAGAAVAATTQPAIRTSTPRTAESITNIDVLRQQIANYYGDPLKTGVIGAKSNYVREVHRVESAVGSYLLTHRHHHGKGRPAIVLDVDDTALTTWNYEVASNWDYNPTVNGQYVTGQRFPATPGMVRLVQAATADGYRLFFITGRPSTQAAATLGNLTHDGIGLDAGYPVPTDPDGSGPDTGLYTKPATVADYPAYLKQACAGDPDGKCTTIDYKSATRRHIESLGYDVVANLGDQFSDLRGGAEDRGFKLPNPNYFIP